MSNMPVLYTWLVYVAVDDGNQVGRQDSRRQISGKFKSCHSPRWDPSKLNIAPVGARNSENKKRFFWWIYFKWTLMVHIARNRAVPLRMARKLLEQPTTESGPQGKLPRWFLIENDSSFRWRFWPFLSVGADRGADPRGLKGRGRVVVDNLKSGNSQAALCDAPSIFTLKTAEGDFGGDNWAPSHNTSTTVNQ